MKMHKTQPTKQITGSTRTNHNIQFYTTKITWAFCCVDLVIFFFWCATKSNEYLKRICFYFAHTPLIWPVSHIISLLQMTFIPNMNYNRLKIIVMCRRIYWYKKLKKKNRTEKQKTTYFTLQFASFNFQFGFSLFGSVRRAFVTNHLGFGTSQTRLQAGNFLFGLLQLVSIVGDQFVRFSCRTNK